jgi:NAD-dependent SIR2 family protein deacetylase
MRDFVERHSRLMVLTGAGISTGSGIADYRDADGQWKRPQPMDISTFRSARASQARYWARSMVGWPAVAQARPNAGHLALRSLERQGRMAGLVTQNVDGLHEAAGQVDVVALHGCLHDVVCLGCGARSARAEWQRWLLARNGAQSAAVAMAPDGDADVVSLNLDAFEVPSCLSCRGVVKPDVVFFGETVPGARVKRCFEMLAAADALLVVGSSLMVYSGFRFCRAARAQGKPIAAINLGRTRADTLLDVKLEMDCGAALACLAGGS